MGVHKNRLNLVLEQNGQLSYVTELYMFASHRHIKHNVSRTHRVVSLVRFRRVSGSVPLNRALVWSQVKSRIVRFWQPAKSHSFKERPEQL